MRPLPLIALCAGLFATQAAAWDSRTPIVPVEVAVACAHRTGVTAPFRLNYPRINGVTEVEVLPGFGVTEVQAKVINGCIAAFSGQRGGNEVEVVTAGGIKLNLRRERCPAVMTGGSSYCIKKPWY